MKYEKLYNALREEFTPSLTISPYDVLEGTITLALEGENIVTLNNITKVSKKELEVLIDATHGVILAKALLGNENHSSLSFGEAIDALKNGYKVARKGWNGKGIFIELQTPDTNSKMTSPYIFIDTSGLQSTNPSAPRSLVPWLASQTDMLSMDWELA